MAKRFIGGKFGDCQPSTSSQAEAKGVYSLDDQYYMKQEGGLTPATGHIATGGNIADYEDPDGYYYRSHTFIASDTFTVTSLGTIDSVVEYLVVGGGGGAGGNVGGGGGAGGYRTNVPTDVAPSTHNTSSSFTVTAGPTSYTVTIGGGGAS